MNIFGLFSRAAMDPINRRTASSERQAGYARYLRSYQGYSVRGALGTSIVADWKRIKFNFVQPIVNLSAGWFAAKPLDWEVKNNPDATAAAYEIWSRSGSDAALLEAAILCGIHGDIVGLATQNEDKKPCIEFVDASLCEPLFDGSDYSRLTDLEIAYEARDEEGNLLVHREMWGPKGVETYEDDQLIETRKYDRLPACWIRNSAVKGLPYGLSDVEPVLDLVEEYDHLASKQTRIVDYYASPHIVFSGIQKGTSQNEKSVGSVFYLPTDAKAYFLEWAGSCPDVEQQLTRIRNGIAEVGQVPAVAFGQADSGLTSISGVALKILYGPLINKTHRKQASWGPALEYLMWLCLRAAGHKVALGDVDVLFPDATPLDGQAAIAEASGKVAARISSRRTVMNDLGIENPNDELKRIIIEEIMLQLASSELTLAVDANRSASLGAHGRFVQEDPSNFKPGGKGAAAGAPSGDPVGDTSGLMDKIDALIALEMKNTGADGGTENG